jgi:hypothetical protein
LSDREFWLYPGECEFRLALTLLSSGEKPMHRIGIAEYSLLSRFAGLMASVGMTIGAGSFSAAIAQAPENAAPAQYPSCQAPIVGEFLLLVVSPTQQVQSQVKQVLPSNTDAIVCNYQNDVVTRVSGFSSIEAANSWAKYMTEVSGLEAFVAKPPVAVQSPTPTPTPVAAVAPTSAYNPKLLGEGYAVLVDYANQPEKAAQIRQLLGQEVGLVAYERNPYLLATHAANQQDASSVSQALTDRGFSAIVVDGRQVVLLKEAVSGQ